jgi:pimeloyl-ACP methyl ester carboxylesterase
MPFLQTSRANFYYQDHRKPLNRAPVTLLIHGAGGLYLDWSTQIRRAPQLNGIAYDLVGHGQTRGEGRSHIEEMALDAISLLNSLGLERVNVVGHSMGGAIALWLACYYPQRVNKLVLVGTGARLPVNPMIIQGIVNNQETTVRQLIKWQWAKGTDENLLEQGVQRLLKTNPQMLQKCFMACNTFDISANLDKITAQTLVMVGEKDKMTPLSLSQELSNKIAYSKLLTFEEGGHMLMLEQADTFAKKLIEWLN